MVWVEYLNSIIESMVWVEYLNYIIKCMVWVEYLNYIDLMYGLSRISELFN